MYKTILLSFILLFTSFLAFSQEREQIRQGVLYPEGVPAEFQGDLSMSETPSQLLDMAKRKRVHRLKIGNKEIPIQTYNGTIHAEKELAVIKNVLTEDFLVNDDTTSSGTVQWYPSSTMDQFLFLCSVIPNPYFFVYLMIN